MTPSIATGPMSATMVYVRCIMTCYSAASISRRSTSVCVADSIEKQNRPQYNEKQFKIRHHPHEGLFMICLPECSVNHRKQYLRGVHGGGCFDVLNDGPILDVGVLIRSPADGRGRLSSPFTINMFSMFLKRPRKEGYDATGGRRSLCPANLPEMPWSTSFKIDV